MIRLENIIKNYQQKTIIHDVSFELKSGVITGLLGPNGAGKTTLIRIINQIVKQDKGFVLYDGKVITEKQIEKIGYLPEERGLYPTMTVEEHGLFLGQLRGMSKKEAQQKLFEWLEKLDCLDWRKKRIEELSKGMAQKIQFICTVLHEPDVLILDEPFSGFDPINIALIRTELKTLKKAGKTILLSTHNMPSVEDLCDNAILINKGKKVAEGDIMQLRNDLKEGLYSITFKGNMLAFANALWTGYEIIEKEALADDLFTVSLKMRGEQTFNDLLNTVAPHVHIKAAHEITPSMENVFLHYVNEKKEMDHA